MYRDDKCADMGTGIGLRGFEQEGSRLRKDGRQESDGMENEDNLQLL